MEKLFTIHARVEKLKAEGGMLGSYARHYYDLYCLAQQPEVRDLLHSEEYEQIRLDYDRVSKEAYPKHYLPPPGLRFHASEALFPPAPLRVQLAEVYRQQCETLCFGPYPTFDEVIACFEGLRERL